ncbi:hypothetical protein P7K49_033615 [Saguinus oedipus]|uniref:Uncharacterized protein n=1 Tax=Saguinus oedipus TaxID=9490 RepID=A0ABQ9TSE5_SAGOE|nr:hypothetical protein P7K49_033615 [Saguinus oedipus]
MARRQPSKLSVASSRLPARDGWSVGWGLHFLSCVGWEDLQREADDGCPETRVTNAKEQEWVLILLGCGWEEALPL